MEAMRYWAPELERFLAEEGKMAFLSGPRQVGKTTLAKHLLAPGGRSPAYFNWDVEGHRKAILKDPEGFWKTDPPPRRIALDEVHKFPRWKRFLKGLFDPSSIPDPGTRFENVVALHLLKLRDAFNDLGHGDFELHYVRDKEKREADFLLTRDRKPWWLIETKVSDRAPAPALRYFKERLKPELAVQVVRDAPPDWLAERDDILVSSAARFLAVLP